MIRRKSVADSEYPRILHNAASYGTLSSVRSRINSDTSGLEDMADRTGSWSTKELYLGWTTILILSVAISLAMQTIFVYTNYATASFKQYSLLSALQVLQGVLYVVTRPLIAKIADAIGRFEGFVVGTVSMTIGMVLLAVAPNIKVYFAAQLFYIVGQVGLQFMQVIFSADTSSLSNRALFNILPNICFAFIPWTAAPITTWFLDNSSWRWGIGIWALFLPACALPLLVILYRRKVARVSNGLARRRRHRVHRLVEQMDLGGSALLAFGLTLAFVAIPLASSQNEKDKPYIWMMLLVGVLCLAAFPFYESSATDFPIINIQFFKHLEVCKSFLFIFLYVVAYSIYTPYFFAWLRVVFDFSNSTATNINVVATVASTVSAALTAVCIRYHKRVHWYVIFGTVIHALGLALIYYYRNTGSTVTQLAVAEMIDGIGAGMLTTPNLVFVQAFCKHSEVAQVSGLYLSFFSLGQVVGDAISGAIYRRQYERNLFAIFPDKSKEWVGLIFDDYTKALDYAPGTPERDGIIQAFNLVMRKLLILPILIYIAMFFLSMTFENIALDGVEAGGINGILYGSPEIDDEDGEGIDHLVDDSEDDEGALDDIA